MPGPSDPVAALTRLDLPGRPAGRHATPNWWQANPQAVWLALLLPALILLGGVFVYPLTRILGQSLFAPGLTLREYAQVFGTDTYLLLIWSTLRIAFLTAVLAMLAGFPVAFWLSRRRGPWLAIGLALVMLPLWTSALVRNYAWILILRRNGLLSSLLAALGITAPPALYTEAGVIIGMVYTLSPYMIFTLHNAMRSIDGRLLQAGSSLGAPGWRNFHRVFLPLSMPGVTSGFLLVFIMAIGFYITPALLGGGKVPMIAPEIDNQMNVLVDWGFGSALSVVLFAIVLATVAAFALVFDMEAFGLRRPPAARQEDPAARATIRVLPPGSLPRLDLAGARQRDYARPPLPLAQAGLGVFSILVLAILTLPVLVIAGTSVTTTPYLAFPPRGFTLGWYGRFLSDPSWMQAASLSLQVAALSAAAAVLLGTATAVALVRGRFAGRSAAYALVLAPLVVPVIVLAVGVYLMFSALGLLGSKASFVLVYTLMDIPIVVLIMAAALRRANEALERAAMTLGAPPVRAFLRSTLPAIWPAMVAAGLFAFIHSFDDVVVAEFISGTASATLPKKMWVSLLYSIEPTLSAISTLLVLLSAALLAVIAALHRRSR